MRMHCQSCDAYEYLHNNNGSAICAACLADVLHEDAKSAHAKEVAALHAPSDELRAEVTALRAERDALRERAEKAEAERDKLVKLREIRGLTLALDSDEAPLSDIAEAVMHITVGGHAARIEEGGGTIMLAILTKHADGTGRVGATFSFDLLKDVSKLAAECAIRRDETARLRALVQAVAREYAVWSNTPEQFCSELNAMGNCFEEAKKWEK